MASAHYYFGNNVEMYLVTLMNKKPVFAVCMASMNEAEVLKEY